MAGYCDCRHVSDDVKFHHEDLDEGDHVHEDHDDNWSASVSEDFLVMFFLFNCTMCLYSVSSSVFTVSLPPCSLGLVQPVYYWSLQ